MKRIEVILERKFQENLSEEDKGPLSEFGGIPAEVLGLGQRHVR